MKITFLTRSLEAGGAQRQLINLAKGLKGKGDSVGVSVFYAGGMLGRDLEEAGIQPNFIGKRGRWDTVPFLIRLFKHIRNERPDIIHSYLGVSNILTVIMKPFLSGTKVVWGVRASNMDLSRYDWLARVVFKVECLLSSFADLIIVNSNAGVKYALKHGFPGDKMIVIPNGIDTVNFDPEPKERQKLRAEWGVADNERLVGLVGRIDPMKDHSVFLEAAALLSSERNLRFVCVGGGPEDYLSTLKSFSNELGLSDDLIWAGRRQDMPAVYSAFDVAVSSSYGEGFPNVIGEAMASGVPCVVTDVGDSALILGGTGVVVPPKDPRALADGIKVVLERLDGNRGKVSESVRERICSSYSLDRLIEKTSEALKGVL